MVMHVTVKRPTYHTLDEAVGIARALAPRLRERVPEAEALRRLPDENVADLLASGLLELEVPKRWGGPELNVDALLEVTAALAEGCSATGWTYALWAAHVWMVAHFPDHIQRAVFEDATSLVSSVVNTAGTARGVGGGYRWTGKGFFCSGADHCTWVLAAVELDVPDRRWFLIPRSDLQILDDWHTVGLKGTGSKTIVLDDVFIPDDRCLTFEQLSGAPGTRQHDSPLYRAAMEFALSLPLAGPQLGIARGMVRAFEERCRARLAAADKFLAGELAATLTRLAKAGAQVASARALLLDDARRFCTLPATDATQLDRFQSRRDGAYAAQLCREAANSLFEASGGSNLYDKSDLQRLWRDSNAASAHSVLMWDLHGLMYGRVSVGLSAVEQPEVASQGG